MALTRVIAGNQIVIANLNQLIDLLTNVMSDQPVQVANSVTATALVPSGLTGATQAVRFGGGTTTGAPTTGTWAIGDVVVARDGFIWICTTAGTPGTWKLAGAALETATPVADGAGAVGTSLNAAHGDHQHPDTPLGVLASSRTWTAAQTFSAGASGPNGVGLGGSAAVGVYSDATNVAVRSSTVTGQVYVQGSSGTNTYGIFGPAGLNMNGLAVTNASHFDSTYLAPSDSSASGAIRFGAANPYLVASSYITVPGGLYVSGGTLYAQNMIAARGGVNNDSGAVLAIAGGTSGYTQFTGSTPIVAIGMTPNAAWGPVQIQGGTVDQNTKTVPNIRMGVNAAVGSEAIIALDSGTGTAFWMGNNGGSRWRVARAGAELFGVDAGQVAYAYGGLQGPGSRWATGADAAGNAGSPTSSNRMSGSFGGGGAGSVDLPVSGGGAGYTMQGSPGSAGSTATMGVENPTASTIRIRYGIGMGGAWATQWSL